VSIAGAGASAADYVGMITAVPSATQATLSTAAGTTVTAAAAGIGIYTDDGIHPVSTGHIAMAAALTTAALKLT
jgi:lysophospholipase L1-like esterase